MTDTTADNSNNNMIKKVIIVGGGPGGVKVAETIAKQQQATSAINIEVTVVDRQNYLDWSLSSPRMLVEPTKIEEMGYVMPLEKVLQR